jgi:hypothetical protein
VNGHDEQVRQQAPAENHENDVVYVSAQDMQDGPYSDARLMSAHYSAYMPADRLAYRTFPTDLVGSFARRHPSSIPSGSLSHLRILPLLI